MMNEQLESTVTLAGELDQRPDLSEDELGVPVATFLIRCGENVVECIARGPVAESLRRWGHGGVEVLAVGRLDWLYRSETPVVRVDRLAFSNPAEVAALAGAGR